MATKKVLKKDHQLPPSRVKAEVKSVPPKSVNTQPSKKITLTSEDVKRVIMENQELRKENQELKNQKNILESILLTAGITVDEKFGDPEIDDVKIPSAKELAGYKDVSNNVKQSANSKYVAPDDEEDGDTGDWDDDE